MQVCCRAHSHTSINSSQICINCIGNPFTYKIRHFFINVVTLFIFQSRLLINPLFPEWQHTLTFSRHSFTVCIIYACLLYKVLLTLAWRAQRIANVGYCLKHIASQSFVCLIPCDQKRYFMVSRTDSPCSFNVCINVLLKHSYPIFRVFSSSYNALHPMSHFTTAAISLYYVCSLDMDAVLSWSVPISS